MGRPLTFTSGIAAAICERLASGETLRAVCRDDAFPGESTVRGWVVDNVEGFAAQYTRAREIGYLTMADELLDVADDGTNDWMARSGPSPGWEINGEHVSRSRLRLDTRKWLLSKALPKIYGDKTAITGADGGAIATEVVYRWAATPQDE